MTELTLEMLRAELAPMHTKLDALKSGLGTVESTLAAMCLNVAGIPMIQRAVSEIQQEQRLLIARLRSLVHAKRGPET